MNNKPGTPVTGDDHFNRTLEKQQLHDRALRGVHTNISAPRRTGKTSLLREVIVTLKLAGWAGTDVDFSPCHTMSDFFDTFQAALQKLVSQTTPVQAAVLDPLKRTVTAVKAVFNRPLTVSYQGATATLGAAAAIADDASFQAAVHALGNALDDVAKHAKAKRLVLGLDELPIFLTAYWQSAGDDAAKQALHRREIAALLYALRVLRQRPNTPVFWLHCGSIGLETFVERLGLTHTLSGLELFRLEPFSDAHTRDMLQALWQGKGREQALPEPVLDQFVLRLGWLIPYFTQQLFHVWFEHLQRQQALDAPVAAHVDSAYDTLLSTAYRHSFKHWDTRLEEQWGRDHASLARALLGKLCTRAQGLSGSTLLNAANEAHPNTDMANLEPKVRDILGTLERDGYILRRAGTQPGAHTYAFRSPLLRDYWLKHCRTVVTKTKRASTKRGPTRAVATPSILPLTLPTTTTGGTQ
jgi:uncharacterized protein